MTVREVHRLSHVRAEIGAGDVLPGYLPSLLGSWVEATVATRTNAGTLCLIRGIWKLPSKLRGRGQGVE